MNEKELYGYRKQIVKNYWNKGLTEEELAMILKLSVKTIKKMRKEK